MTGRFTARKVRLVNRLHVLSPRDCPTVADIGGMTALKRRIVDTIDVRQFRTP